MKRHLRYRLMVLMLALVAVVVLFVGVLLFANIGIDYNRNFYEDMEEVAKVASFFDTNETEFQYLKDALNQEDLLDPSRTDRSYYLLRGETVIYSNAPGGMIQKTHNLLGAVAGEENKQAGLFDEVLDFAYSLEAEGYTFYVVDHRTELMETMRAYLGLFAQVLLLGTMLTVILSFVFSQRFLIPIQKLTEGAKTMAAEGDFTRIAIAANDEVGELTRVFNEMGTRITKNIKMLQALLQNIPKPLFAVNRQGETVHSNEAFRLLFEKEPPLSLFTEGHEEESRFMIRAEGRYFCVYRSLLLMEDGAEATLFLLDDITESEQLEQERKQFVADVSHELKTPLTVIKSYSETLIEEDLDGETAKRFLSVIEKSTDQMNVMVNQLLELITTENAPKGAKEPLDLAAAIRETADAMVLEIRKKELTCSLNLPMERILICEPDKVRRVLVNLLSNSIKYSNPGGTVTLTLAEAEGGVTFAVEDEGIGIEKKHLPHLFDKFYRVDKARSRETGGTGLGLSIVKSIMDSLGGTVRVESVFGKGSIFTCYFPD
ncbi:MAG: HAMP domain-containing protein [Clostridia bacterium]|nr:HAMP domain-containing protein [Clostridia bacterium]